MRKCLAVSLRTVCRLRDIVFSFCCPPLRSWPPYPLSLFFHRPCFLTSLQYPARFSLIYLTIPHSFAFDLHDPRATRSETCWSGLSSCCACIARRHPRREPRHRDIDLDGIESILLCKSTRLLLRDEDLLGLRSSLLLDPWLRVGSSGTVSLIWTDRRVRLRRSKAVGSSAWGSLEVTFAQARTRKRSSSDCRILFAATFRLRK